MTTTPVIVCTGRLTTPMMITTPLGLAAPLGKWDVVLPAPLILKDKMRDIVCFASLLQQQPQSQIPSQAYANYDMGPPQVSFLFQS